VPCEQCYAYVLKGELWQHKCAFGRAHEGQVAGNAQLPLPAPSTVVPEVHELISSMGDDEVQFLAKCDDLIMEYAKKLIHAKGMKKKYYVRDKIREIARFLQQIRKLDGYEATQMRDLISPQHFSACLSAVKQLAGFDKETATYRMPSLALKIGHALKKLAMIRKRQEIENRSYDRIPDIDYSST